MSRGCIRWGWAGSNVALSLLLACSSDSGPEAVPPPLDDTGGTQLDSDGLEDACKDPTATDCPCEEEGARLECGELREIRGDYAICSMGVRSCNSGAWSACIPAATVEVPNSEQTPGGLRLQALSAGVDCKNLCDPRCMKHVDTPDGLSVGVTLEVTPSGLTLPDGVSGGNCNNILVSPGTGTFDITNISLTTGAITVSPANLTFAATCTGGVPIQPAWSIDAYDRAIVTATGQVTPFSGIGSPILITASSANDTTTALIDVRVHIEDQGGATATVQTAYSSAALPPSVLPADAGKTLYPYKNTVFPLGLKAPLVQWANGGSTATDVRVALRFPANSASPTFWYSKIYKTGATDPHDGPLATAAPAWLIPQEIWSAFDRSAAGSAVGGEILIQRRYGSPTAVVHELKIPVKFATEAIPGTVYYTQYRRQFKNACPTTKQPDCNFDAASYSIGDICEVGGPTHTSSSTYPSTIRAIDLSKRSAPNTDPFGSSTKCPVCHSVSANGSTFVTGNQAWVQLEDPPLQPVPGKSIDTIGLDASGNPIFTPLDRAISPTYTGLSDTGLANGAGDPTNDQERIDENSRGFAYAAITPDGSMVLQGPAFWGSGEDTPPSSTTQNSVLLGLTGSPKPFFFARTDKPGVGVQFATTGPLGVASSSGNTLTGSNGPLTVDGYTLFDVDQSVLVKDETTASLNGVYTLSQVGSLVIPLSPWKLVRRYDADSVAELTQYTEVRVSDGNANRGRVFYISSPDPTTLNSSNIQFNERARPVSFTVAPLDVDFATAAPLPDNTQTVSPAPASLTADVKAALKIDGVNVALGKSVLVKDEGSPSSKNGIYTVSATGSSGSPGAKWVLVRRSDADQTGELTPLEEVRVNGGTTNLNKVFYLAKPASGVVTYDTTTNTATTFKLQTLPNMLTPTISPDGNKIAYVNSDADTTPGLADTGWRKGLSLLSFDQSTLSVSQKVRVLNAWPTGNPYSGLPMKWPFFESDSRSLVYVETETGEFCNPTDTTSTTIDTDAERACHDSSYGNMSPTTRGYWKGKLFSIDTAAATPANTRAELAKLNNGDDDGGADDALNADHVYQPTVLPVAKGGYRWVIFTTTRPYGNQLNQSSGSTPTHFSCAASTLWMSAIDDSVATSADRSHPAFLLPGQNLAAITNTTLPHYINERGYLVPSPCKGAGLACGSNSDCCGGSGSAPTAACRAPASWTPASGPPAKTCSASLGTCSIQGQSCSTPADCCAGAACVNFTCGPPPTYNKATYDRTYDADCPDSYQPTWQLLQYYLTTGGDSKLVFSVQTANDLADLNAAPVLPVGESSADVVSPSATPDFLTPTPDFQDVGKVLKLANAQGQNHLRVIIELLPSSDKTIAPILHDWEMRYTCEAAQ